MAELADALGSGPSDLNRSSGFKSRLRHVEGAFPNKGLRFPKTAEKPPFQTWEEVERKIARGGLSAVEQAELWDSVFLTLPQIAALLGFVKGRARHPVIYPMFVFAAHTGARRSELIRSRMDDLDFDGNTVLIREKKRVREKYTTRRVAMSPLLAEVFRDWVSRHPGGPWTLCHGLEAATGKLDPPQYGALTRAAEHRQLVPYHARDGSKLADPIAASDHPLVHCRGRHRE